MYSPLGQIQESIHSSLCETDITYLYREEQVNSIWSHLCVHKEFWHHENFELEIEAKENTYLRLSEHLLPIEAGKHKIFVPDIEVASHPTSKLRKWRRNFDIDVWLRNPIRAMMRVIDIDLLKALIEADKSIVCNKDYDAKIWVMSTSTCLRHLGKEVQISDKDKAYVIPRRGQVPTLVKDNVDEELAVQLVEFEHEGKRIIVSNQVPDGIIVESGEEPIGIMCSRKNVYALPVPDPKRMRMGVIISDEYGICIPGASGFSVLRV